MRAMNERVRKALVELLEHTDLEYGYHELDSYEDCLAKGEDVSLHIEHTMQILHDYLAGRVVEARFALGELYATPGALNAVHEAREKANVVVIDKAETFAAFFTRHECGDWGDLDQADKEKNELSLKEGYRILSAYTLKATGQKLWVITEADRSRTTILRPDEY